MSKLRVNQIAKRNGTELMDLSHIKQTLYFSTGGTIDKANHEVIDLNGTAWKWTGALPYTVTAGSAPTNASWQKVIVIMKGPTANRPTLNSKDLGKMYFDTTLSVEGKPIWWTGTAWVDSTGTVV
jgi:hypothetical protein